VSSVVTERETTSNDPMAVVHGSLAAMCRAGVPLPEALTTIGRDLRRGPLQDALRQFADDVSSGVPLDDAYARRSDVFTPAHAALVSAGLASGDLPGALAEIARQAERRARVGRVVRRALAAPMVSAVVVLLVGTALVALVGPRFQEMVEAVSAPGVPSLTGAAPAAWWDTRLVVSGALLCVLLTCILAALVFAWKRNPLDGRLGVTATGLRWPVIGRIRLYAGLNGVFATLASLVRRDVPLPEALDLVAQTTDEPALRKDVLTMAAAAHDGAGLEAAARAAGIAPPSELWLLRAAQDRGSPEEGLDDLAEHYEARLERAVERAAAILTPAAELAVGAVVFVLAYTFVVPMTELAIRTLGAY
jgi:type II secretory pathway component PulF